MTDDPTSVTPRPRPQPLGRFVLARAGRLARVGAQRFASGVTARHDPQRLATAPRLTPVVEAGLARRAGGEAPAPPATPDHGGDPLRSEAERLSEVSGYSPWAMEYLLGNDSPPGTTGFSPIAATAALARSKQERTTASPATPPRRATIEEGPARPLKLSRTPRTPPAARASPTARPLDLGTPTTGDPRSPAETEASAEPGHTDRPTPAPTVPSTDKPAAVSRTASGRAPDPRRPADSPVRARGDGAPASPPSSPPVPSYPPAQTAHRAHRLSSSPAALGDPPSDPPVGPTPSLPVVARTPADSAPDAPVATARSKATRDPAPQSEPDAVPNVARTPPVPVVARTPDTVPPDTPRADPAPIATSEDAALRPIEPAPDVADTPPVRVAARTPADPPDAPAPHPPPPVTGDQPSLPTEPRPGVARTPPVAVVARTQAGPPSDAPAADPPSMITDDDPPPAGERAPTPAPAGATTLVSGSGNPPDPVGTSDHAPPGEPVVMRLVRRQPELAPTRLALQRVRRSEHPSASDPPPGELDAPAAPLAPREPPAPADRPGFTRRLWRWIVAEPATARNLVSGSPSDADADDEARPADAQDTTAGGSAPPAAVDRPATQLESQPSGLPEAGAPSSDKGPSGAGIARSALRDPVPPPTGTDAPTPSTRSRESLRTRSSAATAPPLRSGGAPPTSAAAALGRSPSAGAAPALAAAATDRPRLHLVPGDTLAADDDAPVPAPQSGIAKAQSIARATAGAITYEDDGRVSVLFPPPGAVTTVPGAVVARQRDDIGEADAPASVPSAVPAPAPAGTPALDRDDLYQDFMRRLRRDVLEQREQLGELF